MSDDLRLPPRGCTFLDFEMGTNPRIHPLSSVIPNAPRKALADVDRGVLRAQGNNSAFSTRITISSPEAAPLTAKFPLSCDSKIRLFLFGEVITCDLKTLDPDPKVIIQLLKTTQSERANYMIVGATYRRSGFPQSAKAIMETMIQGTFKLTSCTSCTLLTPASELAKRGVSESELKPAYLFLAGCESDLVKVSRAMKNPAAASEHYAAARMWLQKVFGKVHATKYHEENKLSSFEVSCSSDNKENIGLMRQIQSLRDQNADQSRQLTQLRSSKRKIEDDYYYERNLRKKYQNRMETVREKVMQS
jgi:hypothetical protein